MIDKREVGGIKVRKKYWLGGLISTMIIVGGATMVRPSLALFTSQDSEINEFETGNVKIGIVENDGDGFSCQPTGTTTECTKKVQIENLTLKTDAVIRVAIVPYWQDGSGNAWPGDVSEPVVHLEFHDGWSNSWLKIGDYYYYTSLLPAGSKTAPLLQSVTVNIPTTPHDLTSRYNGKTLVVDVKAEAVQPSVAAIKAVWPELTDEQVRSIISNMEGIK